MATLTRTIAAEVGARTAGATAGQDLTSVGVTPTTGTGDLVPIGTGSGTLLIWTTGGTGATVVLDTILLSSYGADQDLTVTLPATGLVVLFIKNDTIGRFDQGAGNAGLAKVTPSVNTTQKLYAIVIP